jgi:hypothetical protein
MPAYCGDGGDISEHSAKFAIRRRAGGETCLGTCLVDERPSSGRASVPGRRIFLFWFLFWFVPLPIAMLAIVPGLTLAQGIVPAPPYYSMNPIDPGAPQSPLQQQILQNYRSQLQQSQREMMRENPSGLSREQLQVGHQLNILNNYIYPGYTRTGPSYTPRTYNLVPAFPYSVGPSRRSLRVRRPSAYREWKAVPPKQGCAHPECPGARPRHSEWRD